MDVLVFLLDRTDHLVAVPEDLETEFELVLHLREHVRERVVRRSQQLENVLARLEDRAERHRNDRVIPHHGFVHPLVCQHIFPRRIERRDRHVGHDGGHVAVGDRVDLGRLVVHADGAELQRLGRADDAVDIPPASRGRAVDVGQAWLRRVLDAALDTRLGPTHLGFPRDPGHRRPVTLARRDGARIARPRGRPAARRDRPFFRLRGFPGRLALGFRHRHDPLVGAVRPDIERSFTTPASTLRSTCAALRRRGRRAGRAWSRTSHSRPVLRRPTRQPARVP